MVVKIIHEKDKCIACGACVAVCPKHWEMGNDGRSVLKGAKNTEGETFVLELSDVECNMDAAKGCPVNCIHVEKDEKREI